MPPFRFRLQQVLNYRERLEDEAKLALAQAESALAMERLRLKRLEEDLETARLGLLQEARRAADFWLWQPYIQRLTEQRAASLRRLDELAAAVASCQKQLQQRSMERRLVDKLRHRHLQRHTYEENRRDQCALDETATLAYCRRDD
ncbi:flagellar export protein FliJ [Thermodesulfomicrobium sp. WS]|uniref:flagellar export protein FliJ n=1 Tax=Thermodesulfomicrobium sp. WS TaxID=3004129 RepID=UPI0024917C21|nr:flagellar export protein FliJ [Thermodesulfomicrobium sp. WS]BDV01586.1 flagellar export protein FliJ [Thermodesulfomicrobium sp. WS]